ncbi:hypothetical protein HSE3_gp018 [Bacillus phage vB_BceM-HSE3]|nr:hypothetical protein HSE3_gp018 [Bacillus phage vB_BceM-HSE3]
MAEQQPIIPAALTEAQVKAIATSLTDSNFSIEVAEYVVQQPAGTMRVKFNIYLLGEKKIIQSWQEGATIANIERSMIPWSKDFKVDAYQEHRRVAVYLSEINAIPRLSETDVKNILGKVKAVALA